MRHRGCVWLWLLIFCAMCSAAQRGAEETSPGEQFVGTWTGTWEGPEASSGGFELTLEKAKDGALGGRVSVTGEPEYKAAFKALSFEGRKMNARYDFPPDDRAEVHLTAMFDGNKVQGTWSLRDKASDTEVARGGWTVSRK